MTMTMIERFDPEGADLHIYQVATDMRGKTPPAEPPMSSVMEFEATKSEETAPSDTPMATNGSCRALFVRSDKHNIEPTCIYLINDAMGTIQRVTRPWQVPKLIRLPWDRFVIPAWGAAIASGVIILLHTHTILAFSPGVALALILHCLLELRRERMAKELETIFEGWRLGASNGNMMDVSGDEMIRRMFASA